MLCILRCKWYMFCLVVLVVQKDVSSVYRSLKFRSLLDGRFDGVTDSSSFCCSCSGSLFVFVVVGVLVLVLVCCASLLAVGEEEEDVFFFFSRTGSSTTVVVVVDGDAVLFFLTPALLLFVVVLVVVEVVGEAFLPLLAPVMVERLMRRLRAAEGDVPSTR